MPFIRAWEGIKINKIIEEALTNMIRRIEILEQKVDSYSKSTVKGTVNQTVKKGYVSGMATEGQLNYIKILGGESWNEMTKQEAGKEIDRLVKAKSLRVTKSHQESPEEPQGQEYDEPSKPLTEEEIKDIGEENLL